MEKKMFAFTSVLAGFFSLVVFSSFNETTDPPIKDSSVVSTGLQQHISSFSLDKDFSFADESIPSGNFDALERLDRELTINSYQHSVLIMNIKLANRYFPVIEPILQQYGIPEDLKYLCVAESNLRMATSPAGAKGLWQFMEAAGEAYGLEINAEIDERYHVEKSTEAACKFLIHLKKRFGTWTLAAAAYNMGENGLNKRIEDQRAKTFYDLNLNEETSRYVFRIMAFKAIMQSPEQFGFFVDPHHLYPPFNDYYTIHIEEPIPNLADLAVKHGTNYRLLKVFNPWLIGTSLTNKSGKRYEIRIPKK
jgi:membrane-bound lytic murein transglycosylase D